jgi:transposase
MHDQQPCYAGVDWGSQSHHVVLTDGDGRKIGEKVFRHGGEGLAAMAAWLTAASAIEAGQAAGGAAGQLGGQLGGRVLVAIEVPHGPVVETLLERGLSVQAINPRQMDRFRDRFTLAGAKDDSRDAEVMASALRTDPRAFRKLAAADPVIVELREWSRIAEDLAVERNRLAGRMRAQLWRYFPALIALADDDLGAAWLLALWQAAPTPARAARLREATIARLLRRHRIRRLDAAQVSAVLRQPPLAVAAGTTEAASAHVRALIERLRLVDRQIGQAKARLDALTARLVPADLPADLPAGSPADEPGPGQRKQHDVEILASLPGVGRIVLATLLAEASDALQRRDCAALRSLTGVAPVTKRSGKSRVVVRRQACHRRLANAMYHWARVAMQRDPVSRAKYAALRARGHSHGRALRSVADRLLNVACAMLRAGTLFDPSHPTQQTTC